MLKRILFISIAGIIILIIQGCSKTATSPEQDKPDVKKPQLFPMAVGNSWKYQAISYDTTGQDAITGPAVLDIPRDTVVSNETWYYSSAHGTIYWVTRSDGLWRWENPFNAANTPSLYLKYPTSVGDTIITRKTPYSKTVTTTVSLDSLVETDTGNFYCVTYRQSNYSGDTLKTEEYLYYALGVGWVADEVYNVVFNRNIKVVRIHTRMKLMSYTIK